MLNNSFFTFPSLLQLEKYLLAITQSTSEEEKKTNLEDVFAMAKGAHFSQVELIKWRMKVRDDQSNWSQREEGRFDNNIQDGADEESRNLQVGLSAYYQFVEEKVKQSLKSKLLVSISEKVVLTNTL